MKRCTTVAHLTTGRQHAQSSPVYPWNVCSFVPCPPPQRRAGEARAKTSIVAGSRAALRSSAARGCWVSLALKPAYVSLALSPAYVPLRSRRPTFLALGPVFVDHGHPHGAASFHRRRLGRSEAESQRGRGGTAQCRVSLTLSPTYVPLRLRHRDQGSGGGLYAHHSIRLRIPLQA